MRLRHVSRESPGWTRRRAGKGFALLDQDGRPLPEEERQRVRDLAIPPAWTDVWICPDPRGHLQAVGTDDAGRLQYLYHPAWREKKDAEKFERCQELGAALGRARGRVARDLALSGMPADRACAVAFRLLDLGCFRVGNDVYADTYGSFGLTTLERSHVRQKRGVLHFDFIGKSGVEHHVELADADLVAALGTMRRRRDEGLCLLVSRAGPTWAPLTSEVVNDYIRRTTGVDATAKDFRTWHATVIAAAVLGDEGPATTKKERSAALTRTWEEASSLLGNTPTQARTSYVDPRVVDAYDEGRTVKRAVARAQLEGQERSRRLELAVLRLLDGEE
ncbi:DNA topoisomerase IB [Nocardioides jishulii]|uniref:DNA topoisomerase n=1 Tax=Nocardioides jishulii TaxID=2575440 RepID=A0A4U2YPV0_9ACTN|nr:DNA topoisomerase IB [Nocardioides jishulii]QCX27855.1 DNA topoisomerase IB [Nocardioides jishulii]TKI62662.1 DNA topoisomerase IB [Nocardioides jishulii]